MIRRWMVLTTLSLFVATPAMALVVAEEDFEDDFVDESTFFFFPLDEEGNKVPSPFFDGTFPERGLGFKQHQLGHINNPPSNAGRPGRWIPNQYPIGDANTDGMGF